MDMLKLIGAWIKRLSFRNLSIQKRLPLFICVLLLSVIISFGWISYISVKNETLKNGKERLRSLSNQLSSMLAQSAQSALTGSRAAANQHPVKKYLQTNDAGFKNEALEVLDKLRPDSTWVFAELLNANGQIVLRSSKDSLQSFHSLDSLLSVSMLIDTAGIGKIHLLKSSMYYYITVPVFDNNQLRGYLVRTQKVAASANTIERLSQLMGANAKLYIGNNDGSLWTDMIKPVSYQRLDASKMNDPFEYNGSEGKQLIAAARPIPNTPWLVSVEFSRRVILATASRFLNRIIIIGGILIAVGILIVWLMSRNITSPLNKLTAAASAIAAGDYSATVAAERKDEVGKLSRAFNAMIAQVRKAKTGLEHKIIEAAEMNDQLRDLSAYLQNVREDERIHIAREMHDELGQLLTGFKMDVSWLRKKLSETNDPAITEKLEYMLSVVDESVKFVRKIASELRPSILDDLGLLPALEWHSQEFEKRFNIKVEFRSDLTDLNTSSATATGLFRMFQESLTNVARHSNATKVVVNLRVTGDDISLIIADNGKGFDTSLTSKKTLGLLGMKERAAMIGGDLKIISESGKGTTVLITAKNDQRVKVAVL